MRLVKYWITKNKYGAGIHRRYNVNLLITRIIYYQSKNIWIMDIYLSNEFLSYYLVGKIKYIHDNIILYKKIVLKT